MVIEKEYIDLDYLADYTAYYATCFEGYPTRCKRVHFFDIRLSESDLLDSIEGRGADSAAKLQDAYQGFSVVRPLPEAVVGRTVLRTYPPDRENGRRHYCCVRPYDSNLYGIQLRTESLAFQEQDRVLMACATVALWSALHQTADLFGTSKLPPAQIAPHERCSTPRQAFTGGRTHRSPGESRR